MNFHSYASPWWVSRPAGELLKALPGEFIRTRGAGHGELRPGGRLEEYYAERARYYPTRSATLEL
jgi:hypothetical protein